MSVSSFPSPPSRKFLKGLYVILDEQWSSHRPLLDVLHAAADCGTTLFQYRFKSLPMAHAWRHAKELRQAAAERQAVFIVNDRCDLALAVEADGVHLGQDDLPLDLARRMMGPHAIIGVSTHTPREVSEATSGGASYLGFGPIFPTSTKSDHEQPVGIEGVQEVRPLTSLPMFAIGGITLGSAGNLQQAGVDGVAVVSALYQSADLRGAIRGFQDCFISPFRPDRE